MYIMIDSVQVVAFQKKLQSLEDAYEHLKSDFKNLEDKNKRLKIENENLKRRLALSSATSSKPPSSDGLLKKPAPQSLREKGQKPSGGQPGHKGETLKQVETPDYTITHKVTICEACQASLAETSCTETVERQVFDLPLQAVEVTAHIAETKVCTCGHTTRATFPPQVNAPVQYGPRVQALAVYALNQQLIPEDRVKQMLFDLFKLPIATSTLMSFNAAFADRVQLYQDQVLAELKAATVKHLDETGFRVGGKLKWLHIISTLTLTHYRVSDRRGDLLSDVEGIVVHDHWKPYFKMEDVKHALCNAHHLRELRALIEIEKEPWAKRIDELLRLLAQEKGPPQEEALALYDSIICEGLAFHEAQPALGGRRRRVGHNLLIRLGRCKDETLRFLTTPGVPFTNNQAEQDVRMMKVKQKISGGFRTVAGAENFATIRGFISTERKQGRNIFDAITSQLA